MINVSDRVIYTDNGEALYAGLIKAIKCVAEIYVQRKKEKPGRNAEVDLIIKYFSRFLVNKKNYLKIANALAQIALKKQYFEVATELAVLADAANHSIYKADFKPIRLGAKTVLLYLHKYQLAILPFDQVRPNTIWLAELPEELACYTEVEKALISFYRQGETSSIEKMSAAEVEHRRWIYSSGMKMCLASSWWNPENITIADMKEWKKHIYNASKKKNCAIVRVMELFLKVFNKRVPYTTLELKSEWRQKVNPFAASTSEYIRVVLEESESASELLDTLLRQKLITFSNFDCFQLETFEIEKYLVAANFIHPEALSYWSTSQKNYFEQKNYESPARTKRALGILNSYLFIYLPAWMKYNPTSQYTYPIQPYNFTASHYHFHGEAPDRPLSFLEYHKKLEYLQSYEGIHPYSSFFEYVGFNTPDHVVNFTNPVLKLPRSKRYAKVTKNVFTSDIFPLLIEFCWSLESICNHIEYNKELTNSILKIASTQPTIETVDLGYIPVVFYNGGSYPIYEISSEIVNFVQLTGAYFFYSGAIRLTVVQLETGIRTQGLQWLCAERFMQHANRSLSNPYLVNMLHVNTDKVHSSGLNLLVLNRVFHVLQRQNKWRLHMISEENCSSYKELINYDRKERTKFKDILCLFAYDTLLGGPFSDAYYSVHWSYICLTFQTWYNKFNFNKIRLVALIPAKLSGAKGTYYSWEDWELSKYSDGIKIDLEEGAPYCPVTLRTHVTPHGIRATFVSEYSHVLDPLTMGNLTGQSATVVGSYNKGHANLHKKLEGTLNRREPSFYPIQEVNERLLSSTEILNRVSFASNTDSLPQAIMELGLISPATLGEGQGELNGLQIIARERSSHLSEASTHLCAFGMNCPNQIRKAFKGVKRCALCPFAIFSVNNIIRVSAHKNRLAEDLAACKLKLASDGVLLSSLERHEAEIQINTLAEDVVHWFVIEESLHFIIQDPNFIAQHKYLTGDKESVFEQIGRYELPSDSETAFMLRLNAVEAMPHFNSAHFTQKMERLRREILLQDGKYLDAITNPNPGLLAYELSGIIRDKASNPDFNLNEILRLSSLPPAEYHAAVAKAFKTSQTKFLD